MKIGIEHLSFYIPRRYLELSTLAEHYETDPKKFSHGIGQDKIAIPAHDEDIVTMAAEAAKPLIDICGTDGIDTLLFATESSIDQAKSAGIYVHHLLGLPNQCRNVELKQACYSATAAIQMACGYVARKPDRKVLIIASDVAHYDLDSPGEATQGAGAVAMLISSNPKIVEIEAEAGCYSENIMDFWRPNYRQTPLVDGKYSAIKYLHSLKHAWEDYKENGGRDFQEFSQFCYHIPFSRMSVKAHRHLANLNNAKNDENMINSSLIYNKQIGNCYTASLYLSLISMLENHPSDLAGKPIALFSYGSGATAEFFSAVVQPGYRDGLLIDHHRTLIAERTALDYDDYLARWHAADKQGDMEAVEEQDTHRNYRLTKICDHKRHYAEANK